MHGWIQITTKESKNYEGRGKDFISPESGYCYMGTYYKIHYIAVFKMVEYHIYIFPTFQDILDASVLKLNYVDWLSFG